MNIERNQVIKINGEFFKITNTATLAENLGDGCWYLLTEVIADPVTKQYLRMCNEQI